MIKLVSIGHDPSRPRDLIRIQFFLLFDTIWHFCRCNGKTIKFLYPQDYIGSRKYSNQQTIDKLFIGQMDP